MRAVVVGAGPVGLFTGMALARRGHDVIIVDRDAGPAADGSWARRGVMQFLHPHGFRPQVVSSLAAELPDVLDAVVAGGGILARLPGAPDFVRGLQCRRRTFERAMRAVAAREPRLSLRTGHVEQFVGAAGQVTGVVVDGATVDADVVVCASGRAGRIGGDRRAPAEGGDAGFAYVSRMYRALPGVDVPERGVPYGSVYDGYLAIAFPQDDRTISALVVRPSTDAVMGELRRTECYETAVRHVPQLAPWTDPERFAPITPVMPGGGLTNTYRGQLAADGSVPLAGLFFVGDTMCTTNPAAGRGVTLGLLQALQLLALLDEQHEAVDVSVALHTWCAEQIRPWYEDHVRWDASLLRRWAEGDLDVAGPLPSDVICDAAQVLPEIAPAAGAYSAMLAPPAALAPFDAPVRALLRTGWRPRKATGPTRDELAALVARVLPRDVACLAPAG
jgi:2-polyprenyl-6-methoxyphenol hydroxylase-like FAD-dependent oxidoreductase